MGVSPCEAHWAGFSFDEAVYRLSLCPHGVELRGGAASLASGDEVVSVRLLGRAILGESLARLIDEDLAAVVLAAEGRSGRLVEVLALVSGDGKLEQTPPFPLGDVEVKALSLDLLAHVPLLGPSPVRVTEGSFSPRDMGDLERALEIRIASAGVEEVVSLSLSRGRLVPSESLLVRKPAIYLYSPAEMEVTVRAKPAGLITSSDPPHGRDGWRATIGPGGIRSPDVPYLFYEAQLRLLPPSSGKGWVVSEDALTSWFREWLPRLGLSEKEARDFEVYWSRELPRAPFYLVELVEESFLDENLSLDVDPRPDSLVRVFLSFKPLRERPREAPEAPRPGVFKRIGFTLVEWGGLVKPPILGWPFEDQQREGLAVLRGLRLEGGKLFVRVSSGGCTSKESFQVEVKPLEDDALLLSLHRVVPDRCKALLLDGVELEYDLLEELGIRAPFRLKVANPIYPSPLFCEGEGLTGKSEARELSEEEALSLDLLKATRKAIELEIERESSRQNPDPVYLEELKGFRRRFDSMSLEEYASSISADDGSSPFSFGPLVPPMPREVELLSLPSGFDGELLELIGQSKSGPFYHISGVSPEARLKLREGRAAKGPFKARLRLVFKRRYFGHIPNYYVYLEEIR